MTAVPGCKGCLPIYRTDRIVCVFCERTMVGPKKYKRLCDENARREREDEESERRSIKRAEEIELEMEEAERQEVRDLRRREVQALEDMAWAQGRLTLVEEYRMSRGR